MREIKFKFVLRNGEGKKVVTEAYTLEEICQESDIYDRVYVDLEREHGCDGNCTNESNQFCECGGTFDEYSVISKLQYTGLKDKNGVEIYEGDVVFVDNVILNKDANENWVGNPNILIEIEINECHAAWRLFGICGKVIGNIHQHPELLK